MSASRRATIRANLFPAVHPAVEPWDSFRWHGASGESCDTWKTHSSQALAIDVFGTIKGTAARDAVLDRLAAEIGLPMGGPWTHELEWANPDNPLHERQPTQDYSLSTGCGVGPRCGSARPALAGVGGVGHPEDWCSLPAHGGIYRVRRAEI